MNDAANNALFGILDVADALVTAKKKNSQYPLIKSVKAVFDQAGYTNQEEMLRERFLWILLNRVEKNDFLNSSGIVKLGKGKTGIIEASHYPSTVWTLRSIYQYYANRRPSVTLLQLLATMAARTDMKIEKIMKSLEKVTEHWLYTPHGKILLMAEEHD